MTEMLSRALGASTFDAAARTVEVIWSTGAAVKRASWEGEFIEELSMEPKAIRLERFKSGMSLLDSHDNYSMAARLGTILPDSVRIQGGKGIAVVKISRNSRGEELFRDLQDGHPIQISVGYKVHKFEKTEGTGKSLPVFRAVDWEPMELSVVPIPADPGAVSRSLTPEKETTMPQRTQTEEAADMQQRAEVQRTTDILALARSAGLSLGHELVTGAIRNAQSIEAFREAMLDHLIKREEQAPTFPIVETRGMQDAQETTRKLVTNAMLHRHGITSKLEDGARQYRDMSAIDIARDLLAQRGQSPRGSAVDVLKRSLHSTSDFPLILGNLARETLMESYTSVQNTYALIGTRNVAPDLREVKVLEMGEAPQLERITEKGEYKRGTVKESQEGFTMAHYGKVIGLTEAMLINDQLGAFTKLIANWGRQAARLEGDIAWAVILQNMKLKSDGKALFHADHGNLMTPAALDLGKLEEARKLIRKQKDIDGNQIGLTPKYIFTGMEYELTAQRLLNGQADPRILAVTTGVDTTAPVAIPQNVPAVLRSMQAAYEPRIDTLSDKAWFVFADPADTMGRGLQFAHLAGYETPRTLERWGFDYDGVEYRLDHYFGAGLTDFRFAVKNPGN